MTLDQSRQLDSIRALAAFAVLLGHTYQTLLLPTLNSHFTIVVLLSQFSVMVFFVLSGFLIGKSVCNNITKYSYFNAGRYAADRTLRLYPPLVAALFLMVVLTWLAPHVFPSGSPQLLNIEGAAFIRSEFTLSIRDVWGALTFLNGLKVENPLINSPLWSLSIEVWYYVIAAGIMLWSRRKILSLVILVLAIFVTYGNELFFVLAPVWFAGFGLAFIHQRWSEMRRQEYLWLFVLMSFLMIASLVHTLSPKPFGNDVVYDKINMFRVVSGLWFASFLTLILGGRTRFPTTFYKHASYAYTIYVTHFPIMLFALGVSQAYIYGHVLRSSIVSVIVVLVSLGLSWLLSRWLENKELLVAVFRFSPNKKTV
jgi:peptidoglycan/LPS O-acetylase OafA/YrhL